ncbi:SCO2584 family spore wall biosynthesis protein [Streptomyces sp. NPDC002851]
MPEDVGGSPFPDGWEPDDDHDRGGADDEFASVVFDEGFVRSAEIHEPTAVERLLAAAEARAEAEQRLHGRRTPSDDDPADPTDPADPADPAGGGRDAADGRAARGRGSRGRVHDPYGHGAFGHDPEFHDPYDPDFLDDGYARRGHTRWHRPVAWVLAVVMGVGMVALAFSAVYRGASAGRQDRVPPPATTGVEPTAGARPTLGTGPSTSADYSAPPVTARSPGP